MQADLGFLNLEDLASQPSASIKEALRAWITQKAPACLKHPHGFYVMLLKRSESEEWRLHLWPSGHRDITGMPARIHLHDMHVSSRVLSGELTNIQYISHPATEDNLGHPIYEVFYEGDRYARSTANTLRKMPYREVVTETDRLTVHAGESYRIERFTLHEAWVAHDIATCTLVCMHERAEGVVKLIGVDGHPEELSFARTEHAGRVFLDYL